MGARERWVVKKGDKYFEHEENDGWVYLRNGPEAHETELTDKETIKHLEDEIRNLKNQLAKETEKNGQVKST